jgi:hypothetical protein
MEESGFRFLLLVSTYFVSAGWSNWYEHFEAISSGREFFIKSLNLRVLQGKEEANGYFSTNWKSTLTGQVK